MCDKGGNAFFGDSISPRKNSAIQLSVLDEPIDLLSSYTQYYHDLFHQQYIRIIAKICLNCFHSHIF